MKPVSRLFSLLACEPGDAVTAKILDHFISWSAAGKLAALGALRFVGIAIIFAQCLVVF